MKPLLDMTLDIELTNNNTGKSYRWRRKRDRDGFEQLLKAWNLVRTPFDVPVRVVVTRILGPRQSMWDYSSGLRGNYKELEDALVACGWWHDDGPRWIRDVAFRQDASQRVNGPKVRIQVFEWEGD